MDTNLDETLSRLITAFHVLHQHGVIDERGRISVRHPHDPSTFFTSNIPAILVSTKSHLNQWNVSDGSPVTAPYAGCSVVQTVSGDSEHYAHSCIYDRYPGVQSIVHSHNLTTLPYGLCNSQASLMQPSYQMAGFVGSQCPIFNAADHYSALPPDFPQNLLINHKGLGDALAETFSNHAHSNGLSGLPHCAVVFQRGHGFITWAGGIEDAVYRAVHVCRNAIVQTAAMAQRDDLDIEIVYLSRREINDCNATINRTTRWTWSAWVAQVQRSNLYQNELSLR